MDRDKERSRFIVSTFFEMVHAGELDTTLFFYLFDQGTLIDPWGEIEHISGADLIRWMSRLTEDRMDGHCWYRRADATPGC